MVLLAPNIFLYAPVQIPVQNPTILARHSLGKASYCCMWVCGLAAAHVTTRPAASHAVWVMTWLEFGVRGLERRGGVGGGFGNFHMVVCF